MGAEERNEKYGFLQIDMDDNQWVLPRQRHRAYDVSRADIYLKALDNIKKYLDPYPLTLFLVGLDMTVKEKAEAMRAFRETRSHVEIANHSFSHLNDFSRLPVEGMKKEIVDADAIIRERAGVDRLYGFRSPGYIFRKDIIEIVKGLGYLYDASLFPSYFGPVLRVLNFIWRGVKGKDNFGDFRNGFLPNEPFLLDRYKGFFEIGVSVCPVLRTPVHYSMVRSKKIYRGLAPFLKRLKYLNFVFHLEDFIKVDAEKLNRALDAATAGRQMLLSKSIAEIYEKGAFFCDVPVCLSH